MKKPHAPSAAPAPARKSPTPRRGAESPAGALPGWHDLFDWRGPYLIPLLVLVAARIVAWAALPFASEDAYITFRYARNLASGHGLVYNPGQRVFGFSSLPWTLWVSLGIALVRDPVTWTRLTAVAGDVLSLLLVGRMIERGAAGPAGTGRTAATCFTFFFAAWPYFPFVTVSCMENSVMLSLVALLAVMARRGNPATGPLLGLLALWRPEGLACAAVLALAARNRDRVVGAAILAAALAWLTAYFGSPVPQSVIAKAGVYGTPGPWAGRFWWAWAVPLRLPGATAGEARQLGVLSVLIGPALLAGAPALWRIRSSALAGAVGACLVVWAGYAALGVAYFYWYLLLPLAGVVAVAAVGLPRLVRGWSVYASVALLALTTWADAYPLYVGRAQNEYYAFAKTSQFLRASARPGEKALLEPIGMIGYNCPLVILDETGLVSPVVARRRLRGAGWYTDLVDAERPEWLVVRLGVIRSGQAFAGAGAPFRSADERDALFAGYERMAVLDEAVAGDNALAVLRRR
jgi:hypothetical protein